MQHDLQHGSVLTFPERRKTSETKGNVLLLFSPTVYRTCFTPTYIEHRHIPQQYLLGTWNVLIVCSIPSLLHHSNKATDIPQFVSIHRVRVRVRVFGVGSDASWARAL